MAAHILVGTKKGAFIYTSDEARGRWEISEPLLPGWSIFHMAADLRSVLTGAQERSTPDCPR